MLKTTSRVYESDDIAKYNKHMKKQKGKFGKFFQNEEQLEYFCMLPLDPQQKIDILKRIAEEKDEKSMSE